MIHSIDAVTHRDALRYYGNTALNERFAVTLSRSSMGTASPVSCSFDWPARASIARTERRLLCCYQPASYCRALLSRLLSMTSYA